jgi:hypothetical protein
MIFKIIIAVVSLLGLGIVFYIYQKRRTLESSPSHKENTNTVGYIRNLLFLDTPLELFVIGIFAFSALTYAGMIIAGSPVPELYLAILYLTGTIFFLLLYKASLEHSLDKSISKWVGISMIISALIFGLTLLGLDVPLIPLLQDAQEYSLTVHLLGLALGLGATTVVDFVFIYFLRNLKISEGQSLILHLLSQLIMLGLILLLLSGLALFLTDIEGFSNSPRFLAKMSVVLVVIINGVMLNLYVTPRMDKISLEKAEQGKYEKLKRVAFALGGISLLSWYSVFFLAMIKVLSEFSYITLLIGYLVPLVLVIAASQFAKKHYEKKDTKEA